MSEEERMRRSVQLFLIVADCADEQGVKRSEFIRAWDEVAAWFFGSVRKSCFPHVLWEYVYRLKYPASYFADSSLDWWIQEGY